MQTESVVGEISRLGSGKRTIPWLSFPVTTGVQGPGIGGLAEGTYRKRSPSWFQSRSLGWRAPNSLYRKVAGKVKPGSRSDQLICLTDLFATLSEITETKLPKGAGQRQLFCQLSGKPIVSTRNGSFIIP